jgi:hypothetical protein
MVFHPFITHIVYAEEITLSVKEIVYRISYNIINPLIQVGFAVALLFLVWNIIAYIRDKNSGYIFEESTVAGKDGKWGGSNGIKGILWGLFGLFVMTSAFVIMKILAQWIGSDIPTP